MALTAKRVAALRRKPGRYLDGGDLGRGLYLQVTPGGASWLLRYERAGRERWCGLGSAATFSLKEARDRARAARQLLADGIDPLERKKADKAARALAAAKTISFREAAEAYFDQHEKKWRNAKARAQFLSTLEKYVFKRIGTLAVSDVDTGAVLRVLEQKHEDYPDQSIWQAIPATANRVRGRIENVLDWAAVRGYRATENSARWRGHLSNVLPLPGSGSIQKHHAALPYTEVAEFVAQLRQRDGTAALALEFTILTAARTGEVIGAQWDEIDQAAKIWTVPAQRAKTKKPHRVPLAERALEILKAVPREPGNEFIFIGQREGGGLSNLGMASVLIRMGRTDVTVHGMRSCFRDWAAECTGFANLIVEMALAHTVGNAVEAAYRRGDVLEKRRKLMADWATFCGSPQRSGDGDVVVPMRGQRK
jgi:integrase